MRWIRTFVTVFLFSILFSSYAFAQPDIQFKGNFQQTITSAPTQHLHAHKLPHNQQTPKSVTLLRVELSDHAKETLAQRFRQIQLKRNTLLAAPQYSDLPSSVQLLIHQH